MYYAGLRPEEAINLAADNVILPPPGRTDDEDWGELHIRGATPDAGSEWTDDGSRGVGRLGLEPRTGGL